MLPAGRRQPPFNLGCDSGAASLQRSVVIQTRPERGSIGMVLRVAPSGVELVEVDEAVLSELLEVATRDAHPNEVTPPLSPGEDWTEQRVEWLRSFYRNRRGGLSPTRAEACWAVRAGGVIVGGARLKRAGRCLEAGVWLGRSARHRGVGIATVAALVELADRAGADEVCAETTEGNHAAVSILRQLGFDIVEVGVAPSELPGRAGGPSLRACRALPAMSDEADS
jgi:RimJ/RimL family protein N-acetyltransferase